MISTLHYYNSYKPFILDKQRAKERRTSPYQQNKGQKYKDTEISYFLNKSLNDNIKSYMFELSSNFNGLKNVANNIYEKMYYGLSLDNLYENFENFTHTYNRFKGFLEENSENSGNFTNILGKTEDIINENIDMLDHIGIDISENGFLKIRKDEDITNYNIEDDKIKNFYRNIYDKMCEFMSKPMSSHMDFKDFSYYFNYSGDFNKNNSFKLIEQGILVDISM
ncbi:hypothetical protein [uncultured Tyzzerella sp.]|uniref:hypothetical protein n=1 Tax=uncultured Tyzzerella sp. TaxID=2321398 RepID=UPI002943D2BA|nr:hypothetical protein [uncultured Tyzzerella sp.]